jgi:hypothetical protein
MIAYELQFPPYFDEVQFEITAKGYFADATIIVGERRYRPAFYDPVRLAQDLQDELATNGVFVERSIVVVDQVTRELIERAVAGLARGNFQGIAPEE